MTLTSTLPAELAGLRTVSFLLDDTFSFVPGLSPNVTALSLVNPVPVMVTLVPPAAAPLVGATFDTFGGGTNVNLSLDVLAEVP